MNIIKQVIKFGIVGVIATLIDYIILFILTEYVGLYYLISSIISFSISLIFNYILSIIWVFNIKKKQIYKELLLFVILSIVGLIINQIILYFCTDILNCYYMISKMIATVIVMIYNFITRKKFIEK